MAGQLLLINPRKRTAKKKPAAAKKWTMAAKTAFAQKMAKARAAKKRGVSIKGSSVKIVKRNPIFKRKKASGGGKMDLKNLVKSAAMPSAVSALGALGLDVLIGYANQKLPEQYQAGMAGSAVKVAGAIVLGLAAGKIKNKAFGEQVMIGGLTVTLHDLLKGIVATNMPSVPLGVYDSVQMGIYDANLLGYNGISDTDLGLYNNLGYYNPAQSSMAGMNESSFVDMRRGSRFDEFGNVLN